MSFTQTRMGSVHTRTVAFATNGNHVARLYLVLIKLLPSTAEVCHQPTEHPGNKKEPKFIRHKTSRKKIVLQYLVYSTTINKMILHYRKNSMHRSILQAVTIIITTTIQKYSLIFLNNIIFPP